MYIECGWYVLGIRVKSDVVYMMFPQVQPPILNTYSTIYYKALGGNVVCLFS